MECFRIDEGGYTGFDLLNLDQRFQGAAAQSAMKTPLALSRNPSRPETAKSGAAVRSAGSPRSSFKRRYRSSGARANARKCSNSVSTLYV